MDVRYARCTSTDFYSERRAYDNAVGVVIKQEGNLSLWAINTGVCAGQVLWVHTRNLIPAYRGG